MDIKILGTGCANCEKLEKLTREAVAKCELDATIEKVTDMGEIMAFGVMSTPALVVDGEVKLSGRVPAVADIERILASSAPSGCGCGCSGCC